MMPETVCISAGREFHAAGPEKKTTVSKYGTHTQKASDLVTDLCHEQLTLGHETWDQQQNKNSIVVTCQHTATAVS